MLTWINRRYLSKLYIGDIFGDILVETMRQFLVQCKRNLRNETLVIDIE
jgi:hypothetical protein